LTFCLTPPIAAASGRASAPSHPASPDDALDYKGRKLDLRKRRSDRHRHA
jgi:hypothetical protein